MKYCLVVPHYNHSKAFDAFVLKLSELDMPCIVVDDGSDEVNKTNLISILSRYPKIHYVAHVKNRGKGAAMWTGAHTARALGFTHMLQIDADGQHDVGDVELLIQDSKNYSEAIVSGAPVFDESAPIARVYGRKVTDFWVALETGSLRIKDSLCGFRVYPLDQFEHVFDKYYISKHMEFETDILVKSVWEGIEIRFVDTKVVYPDDGASHFHYLVDNMRLIWLHKRSDR